MPAKPKKKLKEEKDPVQQEPAQEPQAEQAQAPAQEPGQAETVKGLIGDFSGVETFLASTGTRYAILAKAKGCTLSIAPKITPVPGAIGIYTRVRVQKQEDWANLADGVLAFGFPEVKEKSARHASCEAFVAISLQPCSPFEVGKTIEANCILEKLVESIQQRVEAAGQKLAMTPEVLVTYLRNVFETVLPSEPPPVIEEFPVVIGDKEISARVDAIRLKYGPKKVPKPEGGPEHPPGMHGQNPD